MNDYIPVKELHLIKVWVSFLYFTLPWENHQAISLGKLCSYLWGCKTPELQCYSVILNERGREWDTNKQEREQSQKPEESNLFWHKKGILFLWFFFLSLWIICVIQMCSFLSTSPRFASLKINDMWKSKLLVSLNSENSYCLSLCKFNESLGSTINPVDFLQPQSYWFI